MTGGDAVLRRPLRYGMIGGGPGAFIGDVHRAAARLAGGMELVAGAFSSDPEKSRSKGEELGLHPERVYGSWEEMATREAARPAAERMHFACVVTPNHLHYAVARAFLEAGFHVVCDKPMTTTVEEAEALCRLVDETGLVFALTHNYSGYPMVKQAHAVVRSGALGTLRKVVVTYSQDWLATPLEADGQKQAAWRTDPERAGVAGALGDIGSHAEHLARYVTGLELEALSADLTTFVEGRRLEDDANLLLRYRGGARGVLLASQISVGDENDLDLRVYGTDGSLRWRQEAPNELRIHRLGAPEEIQRRGNPYLAPAASLASRLPPGHPEGFLEAFADIYRNAARAIAPRVGAEPPGPGGAAEEGSGAAERPEAPEPEFPTVRDGARGVHFLHRAVESARAGAWVDAAYEPP